MFFREDWKPVLTINSIIYGLQYLFLVSIYIILMWYKPRSLLYWKQSIAQNHTFLSDNVGNKPKIHTFIINDEYSSSK